MKKKLDDILYMAGQDAAIEELENLQAANMQNAAGRHEFSSQYQEKKKALLEMLNAQTDASVSHSQKRKIANKTFDSGKVRAKKWRSAAAVVIAAAVVGFGSLGAYAAYQKFVISNNSENNIGEVLVTSETGEFDKTKDVEVAAISVTPGYIPDGYASWEETDHYIKYSPSGEYAADGFAIYWNLFDSVKMFYMKDYEETEIQGFKTTVMTKDTEESEAISDVTEIFMVDEENGSTIRIIGDKNTPVDELKKVAENLQITYTGGSEKLYDAALSAEDVRTSANAVVSTDVPETLINTDGQFAWYDYDVSTKKDVQVGSMTIESISVTDHVNGLVQDNFFDYADEIAPYVNDDGSLKAIKRTWDEVDASGVHKESSGDIALKCVRVQCKVTNTSQESQEFAVNSLTQCLLYQDAQGDYQYDKSGKMNGYSEQAPVYVHADGMPCYFDHAQYTSDTDRHQYFFIDVSPGETVEYMLAYLVYEDCLNQTYLEYNPSGADYLGEENKEKLHEESGEAFIKMEER